MASKRHIRRRQCSGKVRHASRDGAVAALRSLIYASPSRRGQMNTYRCKFCRGYHIGHVADKTIARTRAAVRGGDA